MNARSAAQVSAGFLVGFVASMSGLAVASQPFSGYITVAAPAVSTAFVVHAVIEIYTRRYNGRCWAASLRKDASDAHAGLFVVTVVWVLGTAFGYFIGGGTGP